MSGILLPCEQLTARVSPALQVYDRVDNSYLFNLNEQSVLDARQFGNKLRFINHSKTSANCYAM